MSTVKWGDYDSHKIKITNQIRTERYGIILSQYDVILTVVKKSFQSTYRGSFHKNVNANLVNFK